jgi:hypothetical protein
MALELGTHRAGRDIAARIKAWAMARFGEGEEAWMVTETRCAVPGRAPRHTIVALIHPAAFITFRIPRPMAEIEASDIDALGEPAAQLAAEGCC